MPVAASKLCRLRADPGRADQRFATQRADPCGMGEPVSHAFSVPASNATCITLKCVGHKGGQERDTQLEVTPIRVDQLYCLGLENGSG